MAEVNVTLAHGLKVGDDVVKDIVLGELTVADIIRAGEEGEKMIDHGGKFHLVQSPTLAGVAMLRLQVRKIGGEPGPMTMDQILALDTEDFFKLQGAAEALDSAQAEAVVEAASNRGRGAPAP